MAERREILAAFAMILDQCAAQFDSLSGVYGDFSDIASRIISYRDDFLAYVNLSGFDDYKKAIIDEGE